MAFDFPNAPTSGQIITGPNGQLYRWNGTNWVVAPATSSFAPQGAINNVGRNVLHNAMFNVQQRGTGGWSGNGVYTADRWQLLVNGDTTSAQIVTAADANRAAIGDEAVTNLLYFNVAGLSGAANYTQFGQSIENVYRLSGKTVTLSFWASGSSGLTVAARLSQTFGTGGSPSAATNTPAQSVVTTATPTRYVMTFAVPSAAGKTFGTTAGTDCTSLWFGLSSGSTNSAIVGVGVQTGNVWFWGIQLEFGSAATQLEKLNINDDQQICRRFYFAMGGVNLSAPNGTASGQQIVSHVSFPTTMRVSVPTVALGSVSGGSNVSGVAVPLASKDGCDVALIAGGAGAFYGTISSLTAAADF